MFSAQRIKSSAIPRNPQSKTSLVVQSLYQINMFSKLSVVVTSVLICCNSVVSSTSAAASGVLGLLGLDLDGLDVPVGLSCSPITVIGNNCGGTTVTCDAPEKEWGGLIAINCIPITL
ncbi:POH2 hydrophobin [Mycena crocata]|nr:POH2 hydrophobin [Mycena crocata]